MIPEYCINEWRQIAPWAEDYQVEQDLLLSRILIELIKIKKLVKVWFLEEAPH